jgi:hypothetical protein
MGYVTERPVDTLTNVLTFFFSQVPPDLADDGASFWMVGLEHARALISHIPARIHFGRLSHGHPLRF